MISRVPPVSVCVVQLAWPEVIGTAAHRVSAPSARKFTVPPGVPAAPLTVAVKVRLLLTVAGLVPAVRTTVVVEATALLVSPKFAGLSAP